MMYGRGRLPSDEESVSSEISDVTSRATTLPDSWSDAKSDAEFQQQGTNRSNQFNIQPIDDRRFSTTSGTTSASNETVINRNPEMLQTNSNQFATPSPQNSNQQQGWVNPYWGADQKPNTAATPSGNNMINNSGNSSSATPVQQLIPGSILINDRGEIDDQSLKKNTRVGSITSNSSFNPGGKYVSDENGGSGGYLAPTHTQRRTVTSPEDKPKFNQQQTSPESTNNDTQPWVNPYWSKPNQENSQLTKKDTTVPDQKSTSSAEPWKNHTSTTTPKQQNGPWENPYLTDDKAQTSTITPKQQNEPWENPYWKGDKSQASTLSNQQDKKPSNQGTNDTFAEPLSTDYKTIPVPSFYERLYPSNTTPSSPAPNANTKPDTIPPNAIPTQNGHDDDAVTYTIDNQGIAHYRTSSPPSAVTNKAATFVPSPTTSQYPVLPPNTGSAAPPPRTTNNTLPQSTNLNAYTSSSFNYHASSITSSSAVFTEEDLNDIQNALRLLETNPNAVQTIEASEQVATFNFNSGNNVSSPFASLFANNNQQKSQQQPPFSLFSQNTQLNSPPTTSNSNPQQNSLLSLFSPNQQFNSPPNTSNPNPQQSSPLSLFSQNQHISSPPNTSNSNPQKNVLLSLFSPNKQISSPSNTSNPNPQQPSPLSLFSQNTQFGSSPNTSNPQQPSPLSLFSQNTHISSPPNTFNPNPQQPSPLSLFSQNTQFGSPSNLNPQHDLSSSTFSQNKEFNLSSYICSSNPQQPLLFSTPSYPSNNSNQPLHSFANSGPIVLI